MSIQTIYAVYFSPTGTTKALACSLAKNLSERLGCPWKELPFTLPAQRSQSLSFGEEDLVLVASPTYAGKLPNKILPDFTEKIKGAHTPAAALVTFGNRSFDNSLAELCSVLTQSGFHVLSGGAFACRHAFTDKLATGRPGEKDFQELDEMARLIAERLQNPPAVPLKVDGDADAAYYVPKGLDGQPAKFLKATPKTREELCIHCGACAKLCPMGSIDKEDTARITGICIKCQSCVRNCPKHAKYFDDPAFLSHVAMLEQNFQEPKKNHIF